ncbi:MAG: hypothetical protein Q9227_004637 [Pyrenula ochraceoflavens]
MNECGPKEPAFRHSLQKPIPQQSCILSERQQVQNQANACKITYELPASYHTRLNHVQLVEDNVHQFLSDDLDVNRLDRMYPLLVVAGRRMAARPLHRQIMMGRQIVVCEQADLHLTWNEGGILIKPFPAYLFDLKIWSDHLCLDLKLYQQACGFIKSYTWLISRENDLHIAMNLDHEMTLLPQGVTWESWVQFVRYFIKEADAMNPNCFHRRYHHGELRLDRLDLIFRIWPPRWQINYVLRGYYFGFHTYQGFLQRNFAWLIAVFAYVSVLLAAMQLGITTDRLQGSAPFQALSYGVATTTIIIPVIIAGYMLALLLLFVISNLASTLKSINAHPRGDST